MADEKRLDRPDNDPPRPERAKPEELRDWETIQQNDRDQTQRLRIVGGWLYRSASISGTVAMVFVPGDDDDEG
jgi:hypothetical protein